MGAPLTRTGCTLVLDVSAAQPIGFDFAAARSMGCAAVVVKATEGETYTDPAWSSHAPRAAESVEQIFAYHVFRPEHLDPTVQARRFCDVARPMTSGCPVLDLERTKQDHGIPMATVAERAGQFVAASVPLWGKRGGLVYVSPSYLAGLCASPTGLAAVQSMRVAGWGLWLAEYRPSEPAPREGAPWPTFAMWQFTGGAVLCDGVCIDLSWFYGDEKALAKLGDTGG